MSAIMTATPTFDQVVEAARRIEGGIIRTPCVRSAALSELCGANVWCKLDYQQSTGSFKERGGRNALMQLDAATRAKGVIAASAGNHALALAYHGIASPSLSPSSRTLLYLPKYFEDRELQQERLQLPSASAIQKLDA